MLSFAWGVHGPSQTSSFSNAVERKLGKLFLQLNNPLGRNSAAPSLSTLSSPLPGRRLNVSRAIVLSSESPFPNATEFPVPTNQHKANIIANHFASSTASNYTPEFTANQHRTMHTLDKAIGAICPETNFFTSFRCSSTEVPRNIRIPQTMQCGSVRVPCCLKKLFLASVCWCTIMQFLDHRAAFRVQVGQLVVQEVECI